MPQTKVIHPVADARKSSDYMPTLDGWRAISILAVMLHHDFIHRLAGMSTVWFFEHGKVGVDVFFAISGILICSRLLDEEKRFGSISLRQFYVRRTFRILPPAILYLLAIALLSVLAIIPHVGMDWFGALFLFRNYTRLFGRHLANGVWFTGHFWSLSVEEHFYLLLPAILVLTHRKHRIKILSLLILLVAGNLAFELSREPWELIQYHSDIRLDSLLLPALMAILIRRDALRGWFRHTGHLWPLTLTVLVVFITWMPENFAYFIGLAMLMPILILGTVLSPESLLGRCLEMPLCAISVASLTAFISGKCCFLLDTPTSMSVLSAHCNTGLSTTSPPSPAPSQAITCSKNQRCASAIGLLLASDVPLCLSSSPGNTQSDPCAPAACRLASRRPGTATLPAHAAPPSPLAAATGSEPSPVPAREPCQTSAADTTAPCRTATTVGCPGSSFRRLHGTPAAGRRSSPSSPRDSCSC